jgi:hypothetical protein
MTTHQAARLVSFMDKCYEKIAGRSRVIMALGVVWTGGAWYTGNSWKAALPIWCSRLMLSYKAARRRLAWS